VGTYGETTYHQPIKRVAPGPGMQLLFTAVFTTAGAGAPTVDTAKSRGIISVANTGTGTHDITLPNKLRNCVVTCSQRGSTAQLAQAEQVDGTAVVTVTTVTAGGNTAANSTGLVVTVTIWGTAL
jgi:hypothetical protein